MADIAKRIVTMWTNEEALRNWFENEEQGVPKLSQKHTKKSNLMVHVTIENPSHEER